MNFLFCCFQKLSKDKNNNKRQNSKRNFTELSVEQNETDEKETARDTKRKKDTSTHSKSSETVNETHAPQSSKVEIVTKTDSSATDRVTRLPSTSSSDLEITLDTSAASDSVILVDSSAAVNETNAFDALDTEDPTESEGDGQFNRPYWSLSTTRKSIVIDQIAVQMKIVDTFFGSKVESPRSIDIFPASKPIARRRSTAVWNTPPRYSMLPKY